MAGDNSDLVAGLRAGGNSDLVARAAEKILNSDLMIGGNSVLVAGLEGIRI